MPETKIESVKTKRGSQSRSKWQERLLPTMTGLLVGLTIFFFIATFIQMAYLHWSILQYPTMDVYFSSEENLVSSTGKFSEKIEARKLEILSRMEAYVIERRYHQASVLLMGRLWVRYLGFLTGMILSLVGASFILGKLRESVTEIVGKGSGVDLSLRSASPGIILVALGVLLMFSTIVDNDYIEVVDDNIYISSNDVTGEATPTPINTMVPPEEIFGILTPMP
jgi:hypothetical protein